ncbi:MAG: FAD-dependent oxidoreductase [Gemmatimonadales bacterium]|jgi:NADPH-dependent 2,4-dienoyl-CoA reductase/sulfur reductase-like enzyme/nitrite reductase/ring-hydroxylating ferredoxin subunit
MSNDPNTPSGPDLRAGIPSGDLPEGGAVVGHVDDAAVILVRHDGTVYGLDATCTHWGGPLGEGLVADGTVRCPWHHACFDVPTGTVLGGPALDALTRWKVVERDDTIRVEGKLETTTARRQLRSDSAVPETIVIVGAGGAGTVAAQELRDRGYDRQLIVVDPDPDASVDRPNLSKDFLAGSAPAEWIPLRPSSWWDERDIDRRVTAVRRIDPAERDIDLENGEALRYGALILATGAEPVRLDIPGEGPDLFTLRTLADARRIIQAADQATRVVVLGAGFIALEVAASLRRRDVEVHVVAPDARPLERIMGPQLGDFVRALHEEHDVRFHLERTAKRRTPDGLELSDGTTVGADFVVMGVGVTPRTGLAQEAGLKVDDGVLVDERLEASSPCVYAVGDIARYPDPRSEQTARIEHWVVAQRQARTAARNALGFDEAFSDAPFFWSQHYDLPIAYVGFAPEWDTIDVDGSLDAQDAAVRYRKDGKTLALATVGRDAESLEFEAELEG